MQIEQNKIYLQDCFEFLDKIENETIDLAIADPPYNMKKAGWDTFASHKSFMDFTKKWIDKLIPKLKTTGSLYIFNNAFNNAFILTYLYEKKLKYRNTIVWHKKDGMSATKKRFVNNQETILFFTKSDKYTFNPDDVRTPYTSTSRMLHAQKKGILKNGKRWFPNPNGKLCTDIWEFSSQRHKQKINGKTQKLKHPTPKPKDLIKRIILASSNTEDLILDLFSGIGTTAEICQNLNRNFTGCENNKEYHKEILKNLKNVYPKPN